MRKIKKVERKMASVRLREEQIIRLRESGNAAAVIRYAVSRWKRGDFVIGNKPKREKPKELLQVFPIWRKPDGVEDWQLREILDQHWKVRDEEFRKRTEKEIRILDDRIGEMFKLLPPIVIEKRVE